MSEITRKLATIERVEEVFPHPNADTLEFVKIRGWNCIVKKGDYVLHQLVVYFEVDSFLPVHPRYEFLRKSSFRSTENLGDGFRIKTIKLRGEISQGLVLPIHEFSEEFSSLNLTHGLEDGTDVTELLKVQKYEQPGTAFAGNIKGNFPSFIPKTDQERLQNVKGYDFYKHVNDLYEVTIKLDGSSMTVYQNGEDFGVCTRNFELKEDDPNAEALKQSSFWETAKKINLREKMKRFSGNFAIQGELVGPGIQHNRAKLPAVNFYVYDIYDIDARQYVSAPVRHYMINAMNVKEEIQLHHIPVVNYIGSFKGSELKDVVELFELTFYNDDFLTINSEIIEGIVCKSIDDPSFSFKFINPGYLLKHGE